MIYDKIVYYLVFTFAYAEIIVEQDLGHKGVDRGWEIKNLESFHDICAHMQTRYHRNKRTSTYYGTCEMWTSVIMTGYRQRRKPPPFLSIMVSVSGSASRGFVRCVIPFPTFVLKSTSQLDYVRFVPFSIASSFPLSFTYFFNIIFRQKIRWIHWAFSKFWTTSNIFYFFFF